MKLVISKSVDNGASQSPDDTNQQIITSALQISLDIFDRTIAYKSEETYFFVLLAWSLIWGIGFASVATLFVTPALLALPKSIKNIFYNFIL